MMCFKELKKGLEVYILHRDTLDFYVGKITSDATPPRLGFGQPIMIVDVSIDSNNQIKIWTLPADQTVAEMSSDANVVIATDKSNLVNIAKSIKSECETYLAGIDQYKEKLEKVNVLISDLDVAFKQQQQTEERFIRLENSIDGINRQLSSAESTLSQILKTISNGH